MIIDQDKIRHSLDLEQQHEMDSKTATSTPPQTALPLVSSRTISEDINDLDVAKEDPIKAQSEEEK